MPEENDNELTRKFIEHDLPLAEISEESAREKNIRHGHPSTLHIWWARRPLASSRATAFASLIDDPGNEKEREEIMELIRDITPWDAVKEGNSEEIEKAQELIDEQYDQPPKVLDPFAGGGSIPLETLRLGCETFASDYNPVAVFIEKATLEWPQKFGIEVELPEEEIETAKSPKENEHNKQDQLEFSRQTQKVNLLAHMVEKWANFVLEEAREEIGGFYPEESGDGLVGKQEIEHEDGWTPVGHLCARTIPCQNPSCGAEIPLIRQFWLCKKKNKKIAYRPLIDEENQEVDFELLSGEVLKEAMDEGFDPKDGTISRANATCIVCEQVTKAEKVRQLSRDGKMGQRMVAVVLHHPDETGKKYRLATKDDEELFEKAEEILQQKLKDWPFMETPLPEEKLPQEKALGFRVNLYGFDQWKKLFNARQQLVLLTFLEKIKSMKEELASDIESKIKDFELDFNKEEFKKAVIGYIGIIYDRIVDRLSTLTRWHNGRETLEATFGRQALPMKWDFIELNPFSGVSGDWTANRDWVLYFLEKNYRESDSDAKALRQSATDLQHEDESLDAVLTDPPYYDNVGYGALSDFFYVWLKRAVGDEFPELFSTPTVPKTNEAIMEPTRHEEKQAAKQFYEDMLQDSFKEMHRVLKTGGIAVIVYAHKTTEGWETMLNALLEAGFVVTGSWPVHTEMKNRLRAAASAALASSIYMVCRKVKQREKVGYFDELKPEISQKIRSKLQQFMDEGIAGGDFFISAIGPAMEEFSKYKRVERYSGEEVTTGDLLEYIRGESADFLVDEMLGEAKGEDIDQAAQFYLTYRWTFLKNKVEFDDARRIATAEGVNMENYYESFIKQGSKYIQVLGPQERDDLDEIGNGSNMVDTLHRACYLWKKDNREELKRFLSSSPHSQNESFWEFAQAVSQVFDKAEVNGKEKKWLDGLLVGKDRYISGEIADKEESKEVDQEQLF